jgi:hypothetical protein
MNLYIKFDTGNVDPKEGWLALRDAGVLSDEHLDFHRNIVQENLHIIVQSYGNLLLQADAPGIIPVGSPILEKDILELFPDTGPENLPLGYANFIEILPPEAEVTQMIDDLGVQLVNGAFQNIWAVRLQTDSEKKLKINAVKQRIRNFETESLRAGNAVISINGQIEMVNEASSLELTGLLNQLNNLL